MYKKDENNLKLEDIDILATIGSDICESIRDLIYNIKEIKNDVDMIKNEFNL